MCFENYNFALLLHKKYCKMENQIAQGLLFDIYDDSMFHLLVRIITNSHNVEDVFEYGI